jgi:hypothetical protein
MLGKGSPQHAHWGDEIKKGSSGNRVGVFGNFRGPEACM